MLLSKSFLLTTSAQTVFTASAGVEGSVHGLVFHNPLGFGTYLTVQLYKAATGTTVNIVNGRWLANGDLYSYPKPINLQAGDSIAVYGSDNGVSMMASIYSSEAGIAKGFTLKGAYNAAALYDTLDVVTVGGTSYAATQPGTGHDPASSPSYWQLIAQAGSNGLNGANAYALTTADFAQPAIGANVTAAVDASAWAAVGQVVYVVGGGYYSVVAKPTATSITLTNLGYTGNAAAAATVSSGAQVSPAGPKGADAATGRVIAVLAADVVNNNGTANTLADISGLAFSVVAGKTYRFKAVIPYTAQATTTGSRWTINGPATSALSYKSTYTLTAGTETPNYLSAYNSPASSNATSLATGNVAIIEGVLTASASGTVVVRFASEIANSAITAKAGGFIESELLN